MKHTIASLLFGLVATIAIGQTCDLAKDEVDAFDGTIHRTSKNYKIGKHVPGDAVYSNDFNTISVRASRSDTLCILYVTPAVKKGCTTSDSYVHFKFADKSALKLQNVAEIDCSSNTLSVVVRLDDFKDKQVVMMRAAYNDGVLDYDISDGAKIEQIVRCVLD